MAKMQDCDIVESLNSNYTITFTFRVMSLGKVVIYKAFCSDMAQGQVSRASSEIYTHS